MNYLNIEELLLEEKQSLFSNRHENRRLAVLIDADNVSSSYLPSLFDEIAKYGILSVKRIYGNFAQKSMEGWVNQLKEYAITPVQQFPNASKKNATDSALIIDAMELLYTYRLDGFCIVSSDSDFTSLASKIREKGHLVYGFGEKKTPEAFVSACDRFFRLDVLRDNYKKDEEDDIDLKDKSQSSTKDNQLGKDAQKAQKHTNVIGKKTVNLIKQSIRDRAADDGFAFLADVGNLLIAKSPSFDYRIYGFKKLVDLVQSIDGVEVQKRKASNSANKGTTHVYVAVKD